MSEHTPGPWEAHKTNEGEDWIVARDRLEAPIGEIPKHLKDDLPMYVGVCRMFRHIRRDSDLKCAEANADLIAVAPEMFEFIEGVARGPYADSDVASLMETYKQRAKFLCAKAKGDTT